MGKKKSSTKPLATDIQKLYGLLGQFVVDHKSRGDALKDLLATYSKQQLSVILTGRYDKFAVFYPLVEAAGELRTLLIDLCKINSRILNTPLTNDSDDNLVTIIVKTPDNYTQLFAWLKSNHPQRVETELTYVETLPSLPKESTSTLDDKEIGAIQQQAMHFLNERNLGLFKKIFMQLSVEHFIKVLTPTAENLLIEELLDDEECDIFLIFLINLDRAVIRLLLDGQTILTLLCEYPERYDALVQFIHKKYHDDLTRSELTQMGM